MSSAPRTAEILIPPDHPCLAGHFPGNPIVPGALLLDAVFLALAGDRPVTLRAVKFLRPVRPGEVVVLSWREDQNGQIGFEGRAGAQKIVLSGSLVR